MALDDTIEPKEALEDTARKADADIIGAIVASSHGLAAQHAILGSPGGRLSTRIEFLVCAVATWSASADEVSSDVELMRRTPGTHGNPFTHVIEFSKIGQSRAIDSKVRGACGRVVGCTGSHD